MELTSQEGVTYINDTTSYAQNFFTSHFHQFSYGYLSYVGLLSDTGNLSALLKVIGIRTMAPVQNTGPLEGI